VKATLLLTTSCNLKCDYCYIHKRDATMSVDIMEKAVNFVFDHTSDNDRIDFGLFGGEPLLAWEQTKQAVKLIEDMANTGNHDVRVSLVTNGTLLNENILSYVRDHCLILQVSCDGIPLVQDAHRRFVNGEGSSKVVEKNIITALHMLPAVLVNMVYGPETYAYLPESIEYLASLGLRQLDLNPDYTAQWLPEHISGLEQTYRRIEGIYLKYYKNNHPLFISLIDEKIAVILRGGYDAGQRCRMGVEELSFSPEGYIFPCERLVGDGLPNQHCIGHLDRPENLRMTHCPLNGTICRNNACRECPVAAYCVNWCGCSNFHATGHYETVSYFICASERLAIESAMRVLKPEDTEQNFAFINHYVGYPMLNSSLDLLEGGDF
jgi:uncharacterized protein